MTFSFSGTILNWINDSWELIERVVDFHCITEKEHTGVYGAVGLAKALCEFDVLDKISSSITSNSPV